jgi:hypothetical protein
LKLAQVSFRSYRLIAIRCPAMSAESTFPFFLNLSREVGLPLALTGLRVEAVRRLRAAATTENLRTWATLALTRGHSDAR